jgi:putative membrane protein
MLKNNIIACLLLAGLSAATACNSNGDNAENKDSKEVAEEQNDQKFTKDSTEKNAQLLVDIAAANYHEIAMAEAAKEKSTNKDIRTLSDMLITDHKKVLAEVQAAATKKSITLPIAESEDAKKDTQKFKEKKNTEFDKDWVDAMVDAHEKSIHKFEDAVNDDKVNPEIKTWAGNTLPALRTHLDKLKLLQGNFKK